MYNDVLGLSLSVFCRRSVVVESKLAQMKHEGVVGVAAKLVLLYTVPYRLLTGHCRVYLSVVVVCCWLSGVGCGVLTVDCR
jgi:hypothetical protein